MSDLSSMSISARLSILIVLISACPDQSDDSPKPGTLQEGQLCESDLPPEKETCAEGLFCNGQGVSGTNGFCVHFCTDNSDCPMLEDGSQQVCESIGSGLDFSYCNIPCDPNDPTQGGTCPGSYEVTLECSGLRCVLGTTG